ncbi:DUF2066 domain-containing protein [Parvularcula lutaonensis]|uniref:DUF2066 domain-containing protein n=1 Tax=Parvularcula lutaonensis TaxID=491923 RepID=A0ABV7MEF1_9PROT|nr:DUF2066 domain-containing protein [Parvularcula lutaonensis]GGY39560.1 hypothetical protein GCM10007148_04840 [Parvularcula lutaonensis]
MPRLLVLIALVFAGASASAQDVFTVPEVPVFAEAKTSAEAQQQARDQGRKKALDLLFRRLVAEEDWIYLPTLSTGAYAPAFDRAQDEFADYGLSVTVKQPITLSDEQVQAFEQETNVFDEKSSGTTYRANITYRFKPDAIRNTLRRASLPYSEEQAQQVMILPVLQTDNGVYLWEAKNPWARAWLERPLTHELTPMVLPRGDLIDTQAITAAEALNLNTAALRAFAERYNTGRLFVALGRLTEADDQFRLYVRLIEATPPAIGSREASAIGSQVTEAFFRGPNDDFPLLARRAVESTVAKHANNWKRQTLVDYSQQRQFELTAWFSSQREWSDIQEALDSTALVVDREDGVFNRENAKMQLTVVGAEEQFELAMRQFGLDVWQDTGGNWHIAKRELAAELKTRLEPLTTDLDREEERRRGLGRFFRRDRERGDTPEAEIRAGESESEDDIPDLPDDLFGDGGQ